MPRIAHLSTMTRLGGVEMVLRDFLQASGTSDAEHLLITTSSRPDIVESITQKGIQHFEPKRLFGKDPSALLRIVSFLREQRVDLLHCYNSNANIVGYACSMLYPGIKLITGEHGSVWNNSGLKLKLDQKASHRASGIIANSEASKAALVHRYGVAPEKIDIAYNPIPGFQALEREAARKQLGLSPEALVLGSVGRLVAQKGYHVLLKAFKELLTTQPHAELVLIGDGPLKSDLQALAQSLQIADKLHWAGELSDAKKYLKAFDLFVSTSLRESFGNVLLEANLAQVPVVAPETCGIPEAILHRETGWLVPTSTVATPPFHLDENDYSQEGAPPLLCMSHRALSKAMLQALHSEKRDVMLKAGLKRAQQQFSIQRYVDTVSSIYQKVLHG